MRDLGLLFALGAIWGASFLFIKVAVAEVTPLTLVAVRLGLGALGLAVYVAARPAARPRVSPGKLLREVWRPAVIIALMAAIFPYSLIAWGEQHISSGAAAILNATSPLWSALLAALLPLRWGGERLSRTGALGVVVGFAGVAALVLGSGSGVSGGGSGDTWEAAGGVAVLGAALCYAIGGL
ncbi:MAG: DMT family transporter, partial [Chloroflexi bacterium]|nr:DMT family transporter [Chloroflexota bacterium]